MKSITTKIKNSARHLFLMATCLIMIAGSFSCSENDLITDQLKPIGTDDASLLAWQLEKHFKTRATSYNIALVTTKASFKFAQLDCAGDYTIDWGDGISETNVNSHIYTDGLPAHTIFLYATFNTIYGNFGIVDVSNQEIIFADISGAPDLPQFSATNNRLTNIDLSRNLDLILIILIGNNLHTIDVSNNLKLGGLVINDNPIKEINVSMLTDLERLSIGGTLISSIDLSYNKKLNQLRIDNTSFSQFDLSIFPELHTFHCHRSQISKLDLSKNTKLRELYCYNTNLTSLDISNNPLMSTLWCSYCKISNIIFNQTIDDLSYLNIQNNPIEQDTRKMTSLVLLLPDRNYPDSWGNIRTGDLWTNAPNTNVLSSLLTGYNWKINGKSI